jgi:hypothetical protein
MPFDALQRRIRAIHSPASAPMFFSDCQCKAASGEAMTLE